MIPHLNTLTEVPLLEGLHPDDLSALAPHVEMRKYGKGDTLFLKGDPGDSLMIVVSGNVELFLYDDLGEDRIILSQVSSGGFFGEVSIFANDKRTANAMATETTEVIIIRQKVLYDFLRKHPEAAIHMINILSKRLRDNTLLLMGKERKAYDVLEEQKTRWDHIADAASNIVGSWRYLLMLMILVAAWIGLNLTQMLGMWDRPFEFNILNLTITILGALQVPLILMSQRRQDHYARIAADLEYHVNLKAQVSILEVNRKLDWLRDAMLEQSARLERLESDHPSPHEDDDDH